MVEVHTNSNGMSLLKPRMKLLKAPFENPHTKPILVWSSLNPGMGKKPLRLKEPLKKP